MSIPGPAARRPNARAVISFLLGMSLMLAMGSLSMWFYADRSSRHPAIGIGLMLALCSGIPAVKLGMRSFRGADEYGERPKVSSFALAGVGSGILGCVLQGNLLIQWFNQIGAETRATQTL